MPTLKLQSAPELQMQIHHIVEKLKLKHIISTQVHAFRSFGSKANARARIYAMPRIWQEALNLPPHYCIEFISHHFDHLKNSDKTRVIIHELLHIPQTFSGALVPHIGKGHRHQVTHHTVEKLFKEYSK